MSPSVSSLTMRLSLSTVFVPSFLAFSSASVFFVFLLVSPRVPVAAAVRVAAVSLRAVFVLLVVCCASFPLFLFVCGAVWCVPCRAVPLVMLCCGVLMNILVIATMSLLSDSEIVASLGWSYSRRKTCYCPSQIFDTVNREFLFVNILMMHTSRSSLLAPVT